MLTTNLVRKSFLSHGLLLLLPNFGTLRSNDATGLRERQDNHRRFHSRMPDSLIVLPKDSSGFTASDRFNETATALPKIELNAQAARFAKDFLRREIEMLQRVKGRSEATFTMIDSVFAAYGLPKELKYLAIVESELRSDAVSAMGARGLWQLMPVTARELGLKVSGKTDERKLAKKSTVAAAKYLRNLHAQFGDWLLALAAYNGGPGTVYAAIKRSGSRNFWALQRYLPVESRGHVKRYIGIHFYFENCGGVTTQTKAEAGVWKKKMEEALSRQRPDTAKLTAGTN